MISQGRTSADRNCCTTRSVTLKYSHSSAFLCWSSRGRLTCSVQVTVKGLLLICCQCSSSAPPQHPVIDHKLRRLKSSIFRQPCHRISKRWKHVGSLGCYFKSISGLQVESLIQVDFRLLYTTAVNLQCGAVGGVTLCVLLGVGAPAALAGSSGLCSVG